MSNSYNKIHLHPKIHCSKNCLKNSLKILSTKVLLNEHRQLFEQAGIELHQHNFIETQSLLSNDDAGCINQLAQQKITVIFTSKNAVEAVVEKLQFQPKWKVFCISGKTLTTIQQYLEKVTIVATAPNATMLAKEIIARQEVLQHVVFFCGTKRLDTLSNALEDTSINLQEIIVYSTTLNPIKIDEPYNGILFFSPSAVESFFKKNNAHANTYFFSIGPSTTSAIKAFSSLVKECPEPKESSLVQLAYQYFDQNKTPTKTL